MKKLPTKEELEQENIKLKKEQIYRKAYDLEKAEGLARELTLKKHNLKVKDFEK